MVGAGRGGDGDAADDRDGDGSGASDRGGGRFDPDPERVALLRETAEDVRGESSESEQLAAVLYRVSDLYDPAEETSPGEIVRAVRTILRVKERGGLRRENE